MSSRIQSEILRWLWKDQLQDMTFGEMLDITEWAADAAHARARALRKARIIREERPKREAA